MAGIGVLLIALGYWYWNFGRMPKTIPPLSRQEPSSYQATGPVPMVITHFDDVTQVTNFEITPDGKYMLVATLPGTVWIYHKVDGNFVRQKVPFFAVTTSQPGWPPQEAGLTGLVLGVDFEKSGDVFLIYSFAKEKRSFRNRITRVKFTNRLGQVLGASPQKIFEANTPGTGSHQIQDGVGVMVKDTPSILFTVGEGFVAARALKPEEEAGKLMLITRDGTSVPGARPFPQSPKVQALGIRNAPGMARNAENGNIMIADTGPNNYDRLLYGKLFDAQGNNDKKLSFLWDGTEASLTKPIPNAYDEDRDSGLHRFVPTQTAVSMVFIDSAKLPTLGEKQQYVLVTLFGRTGEPGNDPGKRIELGKISHEEKGNTISLTPFIGRVSGVADKLGHPIGLAFDAETGVIYFGDIIEGRI
ncbi:MAG: PQQ-dependent sugar dehydrogenase, partial [Pseudomonadota bacterium]